MGAEINPRRTSFSVDLRIWLNDYARALVVHAPEIDALNVFPIPDADTGTNMLLTVRAALDAETVKGIARSALLGARGNSGTILAEFIGALAAAGDDDGKLDTEALLKAMQDGAGRARRAVTNPVEGTILTVIDATVRSLEASRGALSGDKAVSEMRSASETALTQTPSQLPVLQKCGVVDAGGRGFVLMMQVLDHLVNGCEVPEPSVTQQAVIPRAIKHANYEVQFVSALDTAAAEDLKGHLATIGTSVVVAHQEGNYNFHVHTTQPGTAVEAATKAGAISHVVISVLPETPQGWPSTPDQAQSIAFVALASGDGIEAIFRSLGVAQCVPSQLDPAAGEILRAIEATNSTDVILFSDVRNRTSCGVAVRLAAEANLNVITVEIVSPLQAFSALLAVPTANEGGAGDAGDVAEALSKEAAAIRCASIEAATNSLGQVRPVAIVGEEMTAAESEIEAIEYALGKLDASNASLATLVYGASIDEWSAHEVGKAIASKFAIEVEVHRGGGPERYLIGVE